MIARLLHGVPRHALALLALVLAALIAAPLFANDYLLTVLIVILYFAYTGQAWNILMGFAGQLSLGHALYVGLGAYTTAALYVHFGIGPWLGMPVAILISVACGAIIVLVVDVTPPLGPAYTLLAFVIVIVGGLGSMSGALIGGVLIGLTEAMAGLFFTPSAKSMFAFAILVLVLLFRPQGIMGKKPT